MLTKYFQGIFRIIKMKDFTLINRIEILSTQISNNWMSIIKAKENRKI